MAMDTEEMIRAQPMDAVVVIGGCDKTLPAQIMAAVSADLPTVVIPVGPMVVGHHKGEVLGACTDCRRLWARTAPAKSTRSRSRRSTAGWRRRSAPAW
jgi:dihydroxy-acid dehydratase